MASEIRINKKQKLDKLFRENPDILSAKRFTGMIALIWLISRVAALCAEYYCAIQEMIDFSVINLVMVVIVAMFVWTIYQGIKTLAFLPIVGGIFMIIQTFTEQLYSLLGSSNYIPEIRIYALTFIIAAYAQFGLLLFLVCNKKSNIYYDAIKKIVLEEQAAAEINSKQ